MFEVSYRCKMRRVPVARVREWRAHASRKLTGAKHESPFVEVVFAISSRSTRASQFPLTTW
jgi:hypothetical protein